MVGSYGVIGNALEDSIIRGDSAISITKLLIDNGARIRSGIILQADNFVEVNPLVTVILKGGVETAKLLINYGANIEGLHDTMRGPAQVPLEFSTSEGDSLLHMTKVLVERKARLSGRVLSSAVAAGDKAEKTVSYLIEQGIPVNGESMSVWTAAQNGDDALKIVKLLLDKGADVNATHPKKNTEYSLPTLTALHEAASQGDRAIEVVRLLIEHQADIK